MTTFSKAIQKALAVIAFAHALACTAGATQEPNIAAVKARLEEVANSYTAGNAFMGSVLVASGKEVLLDRGYGMADLEWAFPNTPAMKFRLGSLTKQFTAALVLLLQQDGKLRIEDPDGVGRYMVPHGEGRSKVVGERIGP
jgi:CubicO group peptidase (beta-lactamase class C family)